MGELRDARSAMILASLVEREVITAAKIGAAFNMSERTVHRHMRSLKEAGHPIVSEAGVGYMLKPRAGA